MRILFLTDNFPPEHNAPATRTYEHAVEWVKKGHNVTIITGAPNFPKGKVFHGYKNSLISKEVINGVRVLRVWTYISSNKGFLKRIVDYISFGVSSFIVGLFIKTDIIVATSPQFFTAISGRSLSFFKIKPWIMEVRDLWPESIAAVGAIKKSSLIFKILEWIEYKLYNSATKIIVVTDTFKKIINSNGIDSNKIFVHKNGVILDKFMPQIKNEKLIKSLNLSGKKIFAYVGTHGMAHGLSFIINALPELNKKLPDVKFLFIGDGAEKDNLINEAKYLKLENIIFLPSVQKHEIINYLSIIDVALVNLKKSDTFKSVIPSKIFEAAALQKPILLGVEGEAKEIVESYGAGVCYDPGSKSDFIKACVEILKSDTYNKAKSNTKNLAKNFDRKKIAAQLLNTIIK
tara:strand:+ start:1441 stop:2649 length:1209 start_codon:yes stop_codon:yes gene_type:complete